MQGWLTGGVDIFKVYFFSIICAEQFLLLRVIGKSLAAKPTNAMLHVGELFNVSKRELV